MYRSNSFKFERRGPVAAAPDPTQAAPAVTASRKLEQVIQNKHKKPGRKLIKKEVILFYNSWPEPASFACDYPSSRIVP